VITGSEYDEDYDDGVQPVFDWVPVANSQEERVVNKYADQGKLSSFRSDDTLFENDFMLNKVVVAPSKAGTKRSEREYRDWKKKNEEKYNFDFEKVD
jgi:hypothetical protein